MSIGLMTLIIWGGFLVLMATGMPIAFSMIVAGALGYMAFVGPEAVGSLARVAFSSLNTEMFIAIPLYAVMA
ncbi:MAG: hypothetical protein PHP66_09505, partial [Syntrophales bacterium]|nr:hypothetical protein [Syntrophales bacterium]